MEPGLCQMILGMTRKYLRPPKKYEKSHMMSQNRKHQIRKKIGSKMRNAEFLKKNTDKHNTVFK